MRPLATLSLLCLLALPAPVLRAQPAPTTAAQPAVAGASSGAAPTVTSAAPSAQAGQVPQPAAGASASAAGAEGEPDPTEELFAEKCSSCHTVGKGVRVGPDLKGAHQRRSHEWLLSMILTPDKMLATDQTARQLMQQHRNVKMPNLGLQPEQAASLVALIERCSSAPCNLAGHFIPVTQATAADVARGRRLFLGIARLENGGPPCVSCHSVQGAGSVFGGGTLARNLSHAFARLGDDGVDAALRNPSYPLMKDIFVGDQALAKSEAFALRAFLDRANRSVATAGSGLSLVLFGLLGALAVLVVLNFFWSHRLRGVRRPLVRS